MFEITGVSKSYGGSLVLNDVSLQLRSGDRLGLTGGNGSGKSTLINIVTGYVEPDAGRVVLNGEDLSKQPAWKISRAGIRRSFQTSRMLPTTTMRHQFCIERNRCAIDLALIDAAGLSPYLDHFPSEVPLPLLRKAEVVRALLAKPKVLFLDEPSAGLTSEEMIEFGNFMNAHLPPSTALVLVEHRLDLMRHVSTMIKQIGATRGLEDLELDYA
jgi:ABC-type branched-subunit amino acid transport system ATPase component